MILVPDRSTGVWLATGRTDMRRDFPGLTLQAHSHGKMRSPFGSIDLEMI